eukprot:ANDGO_02959.mRNA.1 hypothetical protein H310_06865
MEAIPVTIREVEYLFTIDVTTEHLFVSVEELATSDRWKGEFSASQIEDLTVKVGNTKKFSTFCKMLMKALKEKSDTVIVELLTQADLEELRRKKQQSSKSKQAGAENSAAYSSSSSTVGKSNKRYLILSYVVEFDQVSYPLTLTYDEHPDPQLLKRELVSLRRELREARSQGSNTEHVKRLVSENEGLRKENIDLKDRYKLEVEELVQRIAKQGKEMDSLRRQLLDFPATTKAKEDKMEREKDREIARLLKKLDKYREDLKSSQTDNSQLRAQVRTLIRKLEIAEHQHASMPHRPLSTSSRRSSVTSSPKVPERSRAPTSARTRTPSPRFDPTRWVLDQKEKRGLKSPAPFSGAKPPIRSTSGSSAERNRLGSASSRISPRSAEGRAAAPPSATKKKLTYDSSDDDSLWDLRESTHSRASSRERDRGSREFRDKTSRNSSIAGSPARDLVKDQKEMEKRLADLEQFIQERRRSLSSRP